MLGAGGIIVSCDLSHSKLSKSVLNAASIVLWSDKLWIEIPLDEESNNWESECINKPFETKDLSPAYPDSEKFRLLMFQHHETSPAESEPSVDYY